MVNDLSEFIESTIQISMVRRSKMVLARDEALSLAPEDGILLLELEQGHLSVGSSDLPESCMAVLSEETEILGRAENCRLIRTDLDVSLLGAVRVDQIYRFPSSIRERDTQAFHDAAEELAVLINDRCQCAIQSMARRKRLAFSLLEVLLSNSRLRSDANEAMSKIQRLRPVFDHINSNLHTHLSRAELAAIINISPTRFHALFRECTDVAPMAFVRHRRLHEARKRLASSEEPINVIADEYGFSDAFHFSRQFSRAFGLSPSAFREQAQALFR